VGSDEFDVHDFYIISHKTKQAIFIAAYIENNPASLQDTRVSVLFFDLGRIIPFTMFCFIIPNL
jgi:hypothetical protein